MTALAPAFAGPQPDAWPPRRPAPTPTGLRVSAALAAPAPVWERGTDVLVIGSGVAGLALIAGLAGSGLRLQLVTKGGLGDGSTCWAQGGIARATDDLDDVELHVRDTLTAGAGLCDPAAVRALAAEGPAAVEALAALGARFDTRADGDLAVTREGGHSRARIVHAGGDATGAEVQRALQAALPAADAHVLDHAFLLDLLTADDGTVTGARIATLDAAGRCTGVGLIRARATVLATGGLGQVFASTTNPAGVTGDGMAAAARAGAALSDLEFVQFHPTVFAGPALPDGRRLLISEALRGEGARLLDAAGAPVMTGAHPLADLAPRDVVAARMARVMAAQRREHLFLDARGLGEQQLLRRFPTIVARCRAAGLDPVRQPIPVRPAAHYSCGGVRADLSGRTSLPGLFAIGEVAATGVHGANRLASNSLLEGLVAARRLAQLLRVDLPVSRPAPRFTPRRGEGVDPAARAGLARSMDAAAGVLRDPDQLAALAERVRSKAPRPEHGVADRAGWEATNLHTLAAAVVSAARTRAESRGCHRRSDVTEPLPTWRRHVVTTLAVDGSSGAVLDQEITQEVRS